MRLSPAPRRQLAHLRDISLRGYLRQDGLLDIEGHITDIRAASTANVDRGGIAAGEPVHDMWLRVTIDGTRKIVAAEAAMTATPFDFCGGVAPNFEALVGLVIGPGFIKAANQRLHGKLGCTHLRELLPQLATVAYQTGYSLRDIKDFGRSTEPIRDQNGEKDSRIDSCYAMAEEGPVVARLRAEGLVKPKI